MFFTQKASFSVCLLTFFLSSDDLTFTLITFGYFCSFTLKSKNLFISVTVRNADTNIFRMFVDVFMKKNKLTNKTNNI